MKSRRLINHLNRTHGKAFEKIFEWTVNNAGFHATKMPLSAKYTGRGVIAIKSELDYRIVTREGRIGYFDCKNFNEDYFTYSDLDETQRGRAHAYNQWNIPSGFVVWLRKIDKIMLYTGKHVETLGPRTRFTVNNGVCLGSSYLFNASILMDTKTYAC